MKRFFTFIKGRIAPLGILSFILAAAILYQTGAYDFSFITRSDNYGDHNLTNTPTTPQFSGGAVENPSAPAVSDEVLDSLNSSGNISNNTGTGSENIPSAELERPGKYEGFSASDSYTADGYSISYKDYSDSTILAEISLDLPTAEYGANKLIVEFTSARKEEGAIPYSTKKFSSALSMSVELYMGYLLIDDGSQISIMNNDGTTIGSYPHTYMTPAFARDLSDKPLFHLIAEGYEKYYTLNEETGEFVLSSYDDEFDSRGVYYDYLPGFGLSDNGYKRFSHIVSCIVEMAKKDATDYIESGVPPLTTGTTSTTTAPTQPDSTNAATPPATEQTTVAPAPETQPPATEPPATEPTPTEPTVTEPVVTEPTATDSPATEPTSIESTATEPTVTEPTPTEPTVTEPTTEPSAPSAIDNSEGSVQVYLARPPRTEILFASETVAQLLSGNGVQVLPEPTPDAAAPEAATAPTSDTDSPVTTTVKYSNYTQTKDGLFVSVEVMERRWGFGKYDYKYSADYKNAPDESKLSNFYKYYRLYNFKDGLCAAVDRDGRMSFRDIYGKAIVTRTGEYYGQSNRMFLTGYAEPLLRGVDAIGSLYFDEGYVMVRQIDIDHKYKNTLSGDYQYLVDNKGERFPLPSGYNLLSYSDGVMLLERDGYYGYYSTEGKWIAQPIFTYARPFAEGLGVLGFSGSKKGVIDREGNLIVPFKYDHISNVSCGTFAVYDENGWKLIAKLEKQG